MRTTVASRGESLQGSAPEWNTGRLTAKTVPVSLVRFVFSPRPVDGRAPMNKEVGPSYAASQVCGKAHAHQREGPAAQPRRQVEAEERPQEPGHGPGRRQRRCPQEGPGGARPGRHEGGHSQGAGRSEEVAPRPPGEPRQGQLRRVPPGPPRFGRAARVPLIVFLVLAQLILSVRSAAADSGDGPSFLSRHRRTLLIVTSAGAAAAGVGAALVRRSANERYEEYEETADPDRIEDLYDEASSLDNTAAGLFIAAEALFVGALYLAFFVDSPDGQDSPDSSESRHAPDAPAGRTPGLTLAPVAQGAALALEWRF